MRAAAGSRLAAPLVRLAAAALVVAYVGVLVKGWTASATLPNYSFYSEPTPDGWLVTEIEGGGPADAAGVRVGDHVLAVNGQPTFGPTADPGVGTDVQVGQRVSLRIRRPPSSDGQVAGEMDVAYSIGTYFASPENVVDILTFSITSLLTLLIVVGVAVARPGELAARLLLVGGGGVALMEALAVWENADYDPTPDRLYYLAAAVAVTALLHLFLVFPAPSPLLAHVRRLGGRRFAGTGLVLLYAIPLAATLALTLPETRAGVASVLPYGDWSYLLDVAVLVCVVIAMLHGYRHAPTPVARAQMRWIVWAFGVFTAVVLICLPGPLILAGSVPQVSFVASSLSWLLVPLAVAFAILRYRLFDIDAVVRATFLYPLLVAVLIGAYVVVAFVIERVAIAFVGPAAASDPSVNVLAALALAAAAQPVRGRLQAALDQVANRDRRARRQLAAEAAELLRRAPPVPVLIQFLTERVAARLELSSAWVVLIPEFAAEAPGAALPGPPGVLLERAARAWAPLRLEEAETTIEAPGLAAWQRTGVRLLVPLRAEQLLGVWALGGRRSGELFDREDLDVLARIADQVGVLLDYARLEQQQVQQAIARRELERARALQQRLLPERPCGWPGRLEVAARLRSARETSGDFYDVFPLAADRAPSAAAYPPLQVAVGDVAGKGIGAALIMALARTALRAAALQGGGPRAPVGIDAAPGPATTLAAPGPPATPAPPGPAATLSQVGRLLHRDLGPRDFVACALALLEETGAADRSVSLRLANGGQVAPMLCRCGRVAELMPPGERLPLGVLPEPEYCELQVWLRPGDVVVFASDGLPEAPGRDGELFGFDRLQACVARCAQPAASAEAVLDGIWADLDAWSGSSPEHDDMTLLVLRVTPD